VKSCNSEHIIITNGLLHSLRKSSFNLPSFGLDTSSWLTSGGLPCKCRIYLVHHGRQQRHLNNHKHLLHLHCYYYLSKLSSPSKTFSNTSSLKTKKMPLCHSCAIVSMHNGHIYPSNQRGVSTYLSSLVHQVIINRLYWWFINLSNHIAVKGLTSIFYNR